MRCLPTMQPEAVPSSVKKRNQRAVAEKTSKTHIEFQIDFIFASFGTDNS